MLLCVNLLNVVPDNMLVNFLQVYDEDRLQQDKKLGVAKLAVNSLQPEATSEITLKLQQSLDSLKIKDTKDRGTLHLQVSMRLLFCQFLHVMCIQHVTPL